MVIDISHADAPGRNHPSMMDGCTRCAVPPATTARIRKSSPGNGKAVSNSQPHDYDNTAAQFADAALHEKTAIIAPAILDELKRLQRNGFNPDQDSVIDFGCGPFLLGLAGLKEGIHVDGFDPADNMITVAETTLIQAQISTPVQQINLTSDINELEPESYGVAMMNFVTQCCATRDGLKKVFEQAHGLLREDGTLIVTGAHPEYLHVPHASCQYDVEDPRKLQDGDLYTGWILNSMGRQSYRLEGDHFWSLRTLRQVASEAGFELLNSKEIDDQGTLARRASNASPYFMMTLRKKSNVVVLRPGGG